MIMINDYDHGANSLTDVGIMSLDGDSNLWASLPERV